MTAPARARPLPARLEAYYTAYYRDTLGIPGWRELVAVRMDDGAHERRRLARLEAALGRALDGLACLNVGCGTGGFNVVAEAAGAEAWGVDADAEAAGIADARCRRRRIVPALAEALPFADATFDLVYCYSTLEHVADAGRAVAEMVRVLRPGGRLYLHTPSRWACFEGHYKLPWPPGLPAWLARGYLRLAGRPPAFVGTLRPLSARRCRRLLERAGARVERVLDGEADRRVGGRLWPLVRAYYGLTGVRPHVELLAVRESGR
jgi:SAM-dependent methyltransferase